MDHDYHSLFVREKLLQDSADLTLETAVEFAQINEETTEINAEVLKGERLSSSAFTRQAEGRSQCMTKFR